jgi:hypothetical protein
VHFGVSVGGAIPVGTYANRFDAGWNLDGNVAVPIGRASPIWVALDIAYARNGVDNATLREFNANTGFGSIFSVTANVVVNLATDGPVVPYLLGGAGIRFRMRPIRVFVEARYHSAFTNRTNTAYVPISAGIEW